MTLSLTIIICRTEKFVTEKKERAKKTISVGNAPIATMECMALQTTNGHD